MLYINNPEIVMHPVFGEIRIEEKFAKVLNLPIFIRLSQKSQLGTKALSGIINAKHSRLIHSIGVMYLVDCALKCIKENEKNFFPLNEKEIDVLKLAALGHDLGHLAFSHSMENIESKPHEERTLECFIKNAWEINEIFGYNITSSVLKLYQNCNDIENIDGVNIERILSFRSLLICDIDCDRMEYIMTDNFLVNGKKTDFLKILRHLSISVMKGKIKLVYDKKVLPVIISMLYDRYVLYDNMYYSAGLKLSEMTIKKYIELEKIPEYEIEKMQEYDLLCKFETYLDSNKCSTKYRRIAQILLQGKVDDCLIIRIKDNKQFEFFLKRLKNILEDSKDVFMCVDKKKLCICEKNNDIYIRDDDGVIKNILDFKEVLFIINQFVINYYYVMIDLKNSPTLTEAQKIKIRDLFNEAHIKVKKRFKCNSNMKTLNDFTQILTMYNTKQEYCGQVIETYYKVESNDNIIIKHIDSENDEDCIVLQLPQYDGSDFIKYFEHKFYNCKTKHEIVKCINPILQFRRLKRIEENEIKKDVTVYKQIYSVILEDKDNNFAIKFSYISSNSINERVRVKNVVIEAELIKGNEMTLFALQEYLKKFGYYEVKENLYDWMGI